MSDDKEVRSIDLPIKNIEVAQSLLYRLEREFKTASFSLDRENLRIIYSQLKPINDEMTKIISRFTEEYCAPTSPLLNRIQSKCYCSFGEGNSLSGDASTHVRSHGVSGSYLIQEPLVRTMKLLDQAVFKFHSDCGAKEIYMPSLLKKETLERTGYLPRDRHQVGEIYVAHGTDPKLKSADVCLSPALCLSCYAGLENARFDDSSLFSAVGHVFRYEGGVHGKKAPLSRLWEYQVRELVGFGSQRLEDEIRERYLSFVSHLMNTLRLPGQVCSATDTFFHGEYARAAAHQLMGEKKIEIRVNWEEGPLSVSSFNSHDRHFTSEFNIETKIDEENTRSFCIGFGLERLAFATLLSIPDQVQREAILKNELMP